MTGRDHKTKEELIKYLQKDTDERFWQAINNFAAARGLCKHFLITTDNTLDIPGLEDLWFQESDTNFKQENQ